MGPFDNISVFKCKLNFIADPVIISSCPNVYMEQLRERSLRKRMARLKEDEAKEIRQEEPESGNAVQANNNNDKKTESQPSYEKPASEAEPSDDTILSYDPVEQMVGDITELDF